MINGFVPPIYQAATPWRPNDILDDNSLQVSHDRLRKYELTWAYVDGIFAGVVWNGLGAYSRPVPCWYECVAENNGDLVRAWCDGMPLTYLHRKTLPGMDWYRKFILYEMTMDGFDRVKALHGLKCALEGSSWSTFPESGMEMRATDSQRIIAENIRLSLGTKMSSVYYQLPRTTSEYAAAGFHINNVVGWFQR